MTRRIRRCRYGPKGEQMHYWHKKHGTEIRMKEEPDSPVTEERCPEHKGGEKKRAREEKG